MEHHFNIYIAKEYGILEAILLENIYFWIMKNKVNNKNFYDGYYWTYNSAKAFKELFPYATERKIRNALMRLKDAGLIITGNYNKSAYDRTLWYALTEKGFSHFTFSKIKNTESENQNELNVTPIPDNNTDNKPDDKTNNKKEKKENTEIDEMLNEEINDGGLKETFIEFVKMRKAIKKPLTSFALKKMIKKLQMMSNDTNEQIQILEQSIINSWQGIFPLKDKPQIDISKPPEKKKDEKISVYNTDNLNDDDYSALVRTRSEEERKQLMNKFIEEGKVTVEYF